MAQRIDEAELPYDEITNGRGWGQFLDGPKEHPQVGPYGVCSGIIVRSLAGREHKGPEQRALHVLFEMLNRYQDGEPTTQRFFTQNLRLAYLCLALRLAGPPAATLAASAEEELLSRLLPGGTWGDWWINKDIYDPTPRPFVTSIVLLCLLLFSGERDRGPASTLGGTLRRSTEFLAKALKDIPDWPPLPKAAALAALGAARYREPNVYRQVNSLLVAPPAVTSDLGVYFYDYQFLQPGGGHHYSRDYFIVPIELLIAIVGLLPNARVNARLHALTTIDHVKSTVVANNGAYRSLSEQRLSTKNQAWAAIALKLGTSDVHVPFSGQRVLWFLTKPRTNQYVDRWFPVAALILTAGLGAIVTPDAGSTATITRALALLVIGGLYAPTVFRQLLRGRP